MIGVHPMLFTFAVQYATGDGKQPPGRSSIPSMCVQPIAWPPLTPRNVPPVGAVNTPPTCVHVDGAGAGLVNTSVPKLDGELEIPISTCPTVVWNVISGKTQKLIEYAEPATT